MLLEVVEGDIAALEVDAVANAANDHLWMGAGVAGALKRAGGEEIEREAVALGPIPLGSAVATGAGRLPARWVLHGAVMGQDLRTDAALVRRTTASCLRLADELGARSLALPAFGTGVGGFSLDDCARIMVEEAQAHEPRTLERVVFAVVRRRRPPRLRSPRSTRDERASLHFPGCSTPSATGCSMLSATSAARGSSTRRRSRARCARSGSRCSRPTST